MAARWLAFLTVMLAVGLFAFRTLIARPAALIAPAATGAVSRALAVAAGLALVALPLYVLVATASSRSGP